MESMASRKRKPTDTSTSEEQKKALVYVVHFQASAGESFVCLLIAKDPRIHRNSLQISANGDEWNLPTYTSERKMNAAQCLST